MPLLWGEVGVCNTKGEGKRKKMVTKEEYGCPPVGRGGNGNVTGLRQVNVAFKGDVNGN